jgi:beta-lactamase class A
VLQQSIEEVIGPSVGIEWALSVRDATGREVAVNNGGHAMRTASVGKLLLLIEVARQCDVGDLSSATMLRREPELLVRDSGLWQHLQVDELSVADLCVLIASVSDNLATNVLLNKVALQSVRALTTSLELAETALLDVVRDHRGPDNPATLSTGSASELSYLMSQLSRRELVSPAVSDQVNTWLATGVDLLMVASAFGLDPLAHACSGRHWFIRNKTGSDPGIRADVGTVGRSAGFYSYAVIANWDAAGPDLTDAALVGMRAVGTVLRTAFERDVT